MTPIATPPRLPMVSEPRQGTYVKAWRQDRHALVVQVWLTGEPQREPDGEWLFTITPHSVYGLIDEAIKEAKAARR